jgi:putative transposase
MRQPRVQAQDSLHHVFTRGNNKQNIFRESRDKFYFLNLLALVISKYAWICHSFCLMENHYHLILETPCGGLSDGMHMINGAYCVRFNRKYGCSGHVLQGRFHSPVIEHDDYFLELLRYIALNPVKDGFVQHPADWQWSCYKAFAGLEPLPSFLSIERALGAFDDNLARARGLYSNFVLDRLDEALERARGRPGLSTVFECCEETEQRNSAIVEAYCRYRYKMTEIAAYLGINQATVSRVISKVDPAVTDWEFRI